MGMVLLDLDGVLMLLLLLLALPGPDDIDDVEADDDDECPDDDPSGRVKAPRSVMPTSARRRAMRADAGVGVERDWDRGWDWMGCCGR